MYLITPISSLKTNVLFKRYEIVIAVTYPSTKETLTPKNKEYTYENTIPFIVFIPPTIRKVKNYFVKNIFFNFLTLQGLY